MLCPSQQLTSCEALSVQSLALEVFKSCVEVRVSLTPESAFKSSTIQISGLKKTNELCLTQVVSLLISELAKNLKVTEKMDIEQVSRITRSLLKDFWYLKLEEFVFILDSITKKKNYNRLDQTVIYDAFNEYETKRQSVIENVKILEFQVSEAQKQKEVDELRQLYGKARNEGKQTLFIDKLTAMSEEIKAKALEANKREVQYQLMKDEYNKNKKVL